MKLNVFVLTAKDTIIQVMKQPPEWGRGDLYQWRICQRVNDWNIQTTQKNKQQGKQRNLKVEYATKHRVS